MLFRCSHSFVTTFFLGLVLYSILFPYSVIVVVVVVSFVVVVVFFFCGKDDVLFPNVVEKNFPPFNLLSAVQTTKQPLLFA